MEIEALGEKAVISETCIQCDTVHKYSVPYKDLYAWQTGTKIQDAFPYMAPDARELLISKICGPCFDSNFKDDE